MVTLAGKVETASTFGYRAILARGSSRSLRSVTLVRILGVYDFDMGEWEETPPSVHLALPLAADVHPCNLDDVTNLRKEGQEGEIQEEQDLFAANLFYNDRAILYARHIKINPIIKIFLTTVKIFCWVRKLKNAVWSN